jgi:hypothetical protein
MWPGAPGTRATAANDKRLGISPQSSGALADVLSRSALPRTPSDTMTVEHRKNVITEGAGVGVCKVVKVVYT